MNPINLHIIYLLGRHDCVIVPGFGAFIVERIHARIDSATMTVYPSDRRIGFNSELTDDDGLLVHSIARRGRFSHQESKRMVDHFVRSLHEKLSEGTPVIFDGIGSFQSTEDGRKLFSPVKSRVSETCTLRFIDPEDTSAGSEDRLTSASDNRSLTSEQGPDKILLQVDKEKEPTGKNLDSRYYYLPINKFVVRVACALAIIIGTIIGFTLPGLQKANEYQKASVVPVETLINVKHKSESPEALKTVAEDRAEISGPVEHLPYHLIVGTFSSRGEAEKFIALAEDDSTSLTPVEGRGGMWRVAAASGRDRSELQKELNKINVRFAGVWIWEKR